jgi:hypothetical protein
MAGISAFGPALSNALRSAGTIEDVKFKIPTRSLQKAQGQGWGTLLLLVFIL